MNVFGMSWRAAAKLAASGTAAAMGGYVGIEAIRALHAFATAEWRARNGGGAPAGTAAPSDNAAWGL